VSSTLAHGVGDVYGLVQRRDMVQTRNHLFDVGCSMHGALLCWLVDGRCYTACQVLGPRYCMSRDLMAFEARNSV
jgi:hypothetical protein